ncbi:DAW1 factor, partial [Polypterus senegalus]
MPVYPGGCRSGRSPAGRLRTGGGRVPPPDRVGASVLLWDANNGKRLATLTGHEEEVLDVCFDYTGQFIATASADASSPSSQLRLLEWWWLGPFIAHPEVFLVINLLVLTALPGGAEDSSSRAVGSRQPTLGPNQAVENSISHGALRVVGESPSAREAATKCPGGDIGLPMAAPPEHKQQGCLCQAWDPAVLHRVQPSKYCHPVAICFSPQGSRILTGSADKTARIWDPYTGRCLQVLEGHLDEIFSCAFNYEGNTIITAGTTRQQRRVTADFRKQKKNDGNSGNDLGTSEPAQVSRLLHTEQNGEGKRTVRVHCQPH